MKNMKYIFMVLLGGTMYGTMSSFVKLSYAEGFNAAEISFWQAFLAAILLAVCSLSGAKTATGKLTLKDLLPLLLTGSAIGLTNFLYYKSVSYIPASLAIVILMQFTWFSLFLEWLVFGHRPSKAELLTVSLILVGTAMAGGVFNEEEWSFSPKGILLALSSSLTYAVYIVANGRTGQHVRWQSKGMMIMVGSSLCIFSINSSTILSGDYIGESFFYWVIFLALAGTTIPTALFAAGISKVGAGLSSILMTVELPVAILCSRIILKEPITSMQIVGIIILLASICMLNYYKVVKTKR